jgi:hypothetical protein
VNRPGHAFNLDYDSLTIVADKASQLEFRCQLIDKRPKTHPLHNALHADMLPFPA